MSRVRCNHRSTSATVSSACDENLQTFSLLHYYKLDIPWPEYLLLYLVSQLVNICSIFATICEAKYFHISLHKGSNCSLNYPAIFPLVLPLSSVFIFVFIFDLSPFLKISRYFILQTRKLLTSCIFVNCLAYLKNLPRLPNSTGDIVRSKWLAT